MLNNLKIGPRLLLLIFIQIAVLLVTSITALIGLNSAAESTGALNANVAEQTRLNYIAGSVRSDWLGTVNQLHIGNLTWAQARGDLKLAEQDFEDNWTIFTSKSSADELEFTKLVHTDNLAKLRQAFNAVQEIVTSQKRAHLELFVTNDLIALVDPFLNGITASLSQEGLDSALAFEASSASAGKYLNSTIAVVVMGTFLAIVLGFMILRSIVTPIGKIFTTVQEISAGNYNVRSKVQGNDELGVLGIALDGMLEDRVTTLVRAEQDNENLNESVIGLLQAVSRLAQKDLTVKAPVTEDVTGPVGDALNLLTSETASVLQGVTKISGQVATTSNKVKQQSDNIIKVASQERKEVAQTSAELTAAAEAMGRIAALAQTSNQAAEEASRTTQTALETVTETVRGIDTIRDTIHETEKRIKRLGERSQEISGTVNLINSIAERTHILALNASMHAASAGEAGRGFAVVADEVQRLAENAREATAQISTLVNNIQVETSDTVSTMNTVISQVVDGTRRARQAGERMQETQKSTNNLVELVQRIAISSQEQATASSSLLQRADQIKESTQQTSKELTEQSVHTNQLIEYAQQLVAAVGVFKLPEAKSA